LYKPKTSFVRYKILEQKIEKLLERYTD